MHETIKIYGSHGDILVHAKSGHILECDSCDCDECERLGDYRNIKWFDPARWDEDALKHGETDLICTAFVDTHGYCHEMQLTPEWCPKTKTLDYDLMLHREPIRLPAPDYYEKST